MKFRSSLRWWKWTRRTTRSAIVLTACTPSLAYGQSGSLFREDETKKNAATAAVPLSPPIPPVDRSGIILPPNAPAWDPNHALQAASWTAVPQLPTRTLKIHDIISILVDEIGTTSALGNAQSRKTGLYDARLNDWVDFTGWDTLKPAEQNDGDQRIQGQQNEVYRATSNLQTREQVSFNIGAEIADIRPNGSLVLSARKTLRINDNLWEASLSGVCRPEDVGPDNVILSRNIIELKVDKQELGHVRDGYSRGWFTRWLARFKPF